MLATIALLLFCLLLRPSFGQDDLEIGTVRCFDPKQPGMQCPGATPQYRWYWNNEKYTCLQFKFNGCDGNKNNFVSQAECLECQTTISDAVRCWGSNKFGGNGDVCGQTFNCTKPYMCLQTWPSPRCCDDSDSMCPNEHRAYRTETDEVFGDNCDDLQCPSGHGCSQGKFVARCCPTA